MRQGWKRDYAMVYTGAMSTMRKTIGRPVAISVLLSVTTPALANRAAGDACAAKLTPNAAEIYRATAPDIRPDSDVKAALLARVKPMVQSGKLDRSSARAAAEEAGPCLKTIQQ